LAAAFFSLGHVTIRRGVTELGVTLGTAIMLPSGMLTACLVALLLEGPDAILSASWSSVAFFAVAGLIHFVAGWGFQNAGARLIGATRMSAMTSLVPLFATVLAFLTLNEGVNTYIAGGILLTVAGIYLTTTS
jgi:drug/metabolite transporter (DMT)-like permease